MNSAYVARRVMMEVDMKNGLKLYLGRLEEETAGILVS
jgi:hypothetical protein